MTMLKDYPVSWLVSSLPVTVCLYVGIAGFEWIKRKNWKIGWVRLTAMVWVAGNWENIWRKRKLIEQAGGRDLGKKEMELFSAKALTDLFRDFAK